MKKIMFALFALLLAPLTASAQYGGFQQQFFPGGQQVIDVPVPAYFFVPQIRFRPFLVQANQSFQPEIRPFSNGGFQQQFYGGNGQRIIMGNGFSGQFSNGFPGQFSNGYGGNGFSNGFARSGQFNGNGFARSGYGGGFPGQFAQQQRFIAPRSC